MEPQAPGSGQTPESRPLPKSEASLLRKDISRLQFDIPPNDRISLSVTKALMEGIPEENLTDDQLDRMTFARGFLAYTAQQFMSKELGHLPDSKFSRHTGEIIPPMKYDQNGRPTLESLMSLDKRIWVFRGDIQSLVNKAYEEGIKIPPIDDAGNEIPQDSLLALLKLKEQQSQSPIPQRPEQIPSTASADEQQTPAEKKADDDAWIDAHSGNISGLSLKLQDKITKLRSFGGSPQEFKEMLDEAQKMFFQQRKGNNEAGKLEELRKEVQEQVQNPTPENTSLPKQETQEEWLASQTIGGMRSVPPVGPVHIGSILTPEQLRAKRASQQSTPKPQPPTRPNLDF